jgi:Skp family chaperone for outer membrane proteins
MKSTVLFAIAAAIPGIFLAQSTGSSSVAVIDFERAVEETPAGKDAITKLNAFGTEQRAAIDKKQKEADDLQTRLRVQDRELSETARAQLTKDLKDAETALHTMTDSAQQKFQQMEQTLLVPVQQKTMDAVKAYATEHSVKIVLDTSTLQNGIVYWHDTADITTEIIRRIALNIANPHPQKDAAAKLIERLRTRPWAVPAPTVEEANSALHR